MSRRRPRRLRPHRNTPAFESLEQRRLMTYVASSSSFEFDDLVPGALGNTLLIDNQDDGIASINLDALEGGPNTFTYFGVAYHQIFVSSNGLITLVNGSSDPNNGDLSSSPPQRTIAVLWDDWDTSVGGSGATNSSVLYRYDDDREELTIEWNNVTHLEVGGNNGVTFQAILDLNESGNRTDEMQFQYADLTVGNPAYDNGASATVGIKNVGIASGDNRLLVFQNGGGSLAHLVGVNRCFEIDDANVLLNSTALGYLTSPHTLTLVFDQTVTDLDATDLEVRPIGGGSSFSPVSVTGEGTNTAVFTFAGAIPDGRFTGTIEEDAIRNSTGALSSADVTTTPFFFLRGDANHDAVVNLQDFNLLAANFGQSGRDFSQGDFDYSGTVNLQDFNLLAARFGQSVAPATTTSVVNTVFGKTGTRSPFGESRIGGAEAVGHDDERARDLLA